MNTEPVFAHLRVMASDGAEHVVPISHSPFCIGRAGHNDLALAGEQISRHHACLRVEGDQIQLIDMGSENGTWIGTTQLVPNQAQTLDFFEKFRIGSYQFRLEPASVAPARPEVAKASTPSPTLAPTAAYDMGKSFQPPIEPRVTSSPGGRLGVMVRTTQLVVTPGISANVSLVIMNQSQNSDGFRITVSGIPESWLTAPLPIVELPPNERQEVNLTIHPPRSPQTRADSYRLSLQVTSQSVLTEMVEVWATLTIVAYSAFATRLHPPRVDAHDPAQIVVRNDGNAAETFRLTWEDPEDRYEFRPAELQMTLAAGETAATEFRAIPRRRRLFGGSQIDVYSATITPAGGQPRSHTGQIVTTGLLPVWSIAILFLLVTLCAVGSGATALALFGTTPTPDATGIVTPTPTGTVTGLDSDGDGLIDEEEARLGSDPRSPDTDRDGLTDFDEVRRGTSPILADTDGDTLLDGQEAFGCSDPRNPDTDGDGQRDNIDPDPCRLPTPTNIPAPTMTPIPTLTPLPSATPIPTSTPLPTNTPLPTDTPLPTATPTALPSPTPIITEWRGEYYGTTDLLGTPLVVRNEVDVNFNWGSSSPDPLIPADRFSARWTRTLNFEGRMYRFSVQADDGVRVFVDNILIIDEWHAAPPFPPTYTADVNLTPGPHTLRVEYYEDVIDAYLLFSFTAAS